jgi:hypothetical protein
MIEKRKINNKVHNLSLLIKFCFYTQPDKAKSHMVSFYILANAGHFLTF